MEPGVAEFISALAAGTGARVMVEVCGDSGAGPTTLALIAAASQTGGHAVCILRGPEELHSSTRFLGPDHSRQVDLVLGDPEELLLREYRSADFVLVDCQVCKTKWCIKIEKIYYITVHHIIYIQSITFFLANICHLFDRCI